MSAHFISSVDGGGVTFGAIGLASPTLLATKQYHPAAAACLHGPMVVFQRAPGRWELSTACGEGFEAIPAPPIEEPSGVLTCSSAGATFGGQFLAWPSRH
jgi:hypothetical protein